MKNSEKSRITAGASSDVGNLRKANEDSFYISEEESLLIVCDGMGGQVAGGLASKIAVETIKDVYLNMQFSTMAKLFPDLNGDSLPESAQKLVAAVRLANRRIYKTASKFPKLRGMGTTVVALTLDSSLATMVHVGDSRIFRVSDRKMLQLTEDHSWLNELIADDEIDEEDIETFSKKNVITRALGSNPVIKIDIHCEKYKKDDIYILATDGLHNAIPNSGIERIIAKSHNRSLEKVTKKLTDSAKKIDGSDNITVAIGQVNQHGKDSQQLGTSKTVHEEDEKTRFKEDKFIIDRYGQPKMVFGKIQMSIKTPFRIFMASLALFLVTLGIYVVKGGSSGKFQTYLNPIRQSQPTAQAAGHRNNTAGLESLSLIPKSSNSESPVVTQSKVSEDAVIAYVFFNSKEDFEKAMLHKRGGLIGTFQPYLDLDGDTGGKLTFFVFDEDGNVIHKCVDMQLPEIE